MSKFTLIYGFSGRYGREWSTAFEASGYAANCSDEVDAESPEAAVAMLEDGAGFGPAEDWYLDRENNLFVIWKPEADEED
jgi:hypothetical protein